MSVTPALPMSGGCPCGAIRYRITSFPLLLYACHCTNCQRATGSAFALNMPVATKDFHIFQGEPRGWHHVSPGGVAVISWFCGDCGGRIHGERAGRPDSVIVRAGTLDDTRWLIPAAHLFMKSAQPWVVPPAGAPCHEMELADPRPLAAAWRRARWQEFFPPK